MSSKHIVGSVDVIMQGYTEEIRLFVSTTKEKDHQLGLTRGWNFLNDYVEMDSIQRDGRSIVGKKGGELPQGSSETSKDRYPLLKINILLNSYKQWLETISKMDEQ